MRNRALAAAAAVTVSSIVAINSQAATVTWTGAVNATWDTTTANWAGDSSTYTAMDYDGVSVINTYGDDAVFTDDTAITNTTITLVTAPVPMRPNSVTFAHVSGGGPLTYTFTNSLFGAYPVDGTNGQSTTSILLDTGFNGKVILKGAAAAVAPGTTTIRSGTLELFIPSALPNNGVSTNKPGNVQLAGGTLSIDSTTNSPGTALLDGFLQVTANSTIQQAGTNAANNMRVWGQAATSTISLSPGATLTVNPNATNTANIFADIGSVITGTGTISLGSTTNLTNLPILRFTNLQAGGATNQATYDAGSGNGIIRVTAAGTFSMGALTGGANTRLENGSGGAVTYSVGQKAGSTTFDGTIADGTTGQSVFAAAGNPTSFTKGGSSSTGSTLTLTSANTYGGQTTVTAGVLKLGNASALGTPLASGAVNSGTSFTLSTIKGTTVSGTSTVVGTLDVNGNSLASEPLTLSGGKLTNTSASAATVSGGSLAGFQVTNIGSGYSSAPTVNVGGGASATAALGLSSASVALTGGGAHYRGNSPTAGLAGGGGSGGSVSVAYGINSDSFTTSNLTGVGGIVANKVGLGYVPNTTNLIPLTFSNPTNTNPAIPNITAQGFAITDGSGQVIGFNITNPGSGYLDTGNTVTIPAPAGAYLDPGFGGTPVTAVANRAQAVNGNNNDRNWFKVVALYVPQPGVGYSSAPTITMPTPTVLANGGVTATATTNGTNFVVSGVQINNLGSGFTSNPTVTLTGGGGTGAVIQAIRPTLTLNVPPAGATNSIGGDNGNMTLSLTMTGTGGFTKVGSNTLTLTEVNNYSGATAVQLGKLVVNGSIATSAVSVASGATLGGSGTVGSLTAAAGSTIAPGNSIESLDVNGNAVIDGLLQVEYDGSVSPAIDLLNVNGTLDITGATVDFIALGGVLTEPYYVFVTSTAPVTGTFTELNVPAGYQVFYQHNGTDIVLAVPEPTSLGLLSLGALAMGRRRRNVA